MTGTVVGVLRGGPSREHEHSLLSGHAVVANLPRDRFTVRDIYIDKQGIWHERGKPSTPADILRTVDVAVSTLPGEYGQGGELQRLLEQFGIPYVGPDPLNSYMAMHKVLSKEKVRALGLKTPKYHFVQAGADVDAATYEIIRSFQQPIVVKPATASSAHEAEVVGGYAHVHQSISRGIQEKKDLIIEELIRGTGASVGVIEKFRDVPLYVLPPAEADFIPGRFPRQTQEELMEYARKLHTEFGQRHYSRSEFIVARTGIYFMGISNATAINLSKESEFQKSLSSVGIAFPDFLLHVIGLALNY